MKREDLLNEIISLAADLEDGETGTDRCIELVCEKLCEEAQKKAFTDGALAAGIPLSVIEGRTKLTDHFSDSYILSQCSQETQARAAEKAATADTETLTYYEPDCDLCSACKEHAEFTRECGSNCCGAPPYDVDPPDRD